MDSELKDISKDSSHDSSGGEGSGKDMRPLLKSESSVSASPATTDTLQELEKKYAPYVRRDAYGTMGLGELPPSEKFLLGVALVTLVPLRFFAGLFILVLYYLICRICTAFSAPYRGEDEQEDYAHMTGWRREVIVRSGQYLSRALFFVMGFYWISETYRIPPSWEKDADENEGKEPSEEPEQPGAIISNHISYLDILYHMSSSFPSFVAKFFYVVLVLTFFPFSIAFWISLLKRSVSRLPLVGLMSKCLGCVFVQRESRSTDFKGVSGVVIERVQAAHHNKLAPMMMLFPEGTTTNGDFLLPFKTGAFLAKAPVLPVILRYPYQRFSPAWDSISGVRHVILLLCQFVNHIEVIRLPVYHPSQQEKDDPKLYANNVRKLMANEGNLVLSDIGLAEKRVYHAALNGNSLPSVLHQKDD